MKTGLRDVRREGAARRAPAEVPLDARVALAARIGNQGLMRMLAREPAATQAPAIPDWIRDIYVKAGMKPDAAIALLNAAGPSGLAMFSRVWHFQNDPVDARRVNIHRNNSWESSLDWDKVHPYVSPTDPTSAAPLKTYGSLREVFYKHRSQQLQTTFGVQSIDVVITAAEVAQLQGDPIAEKIRDLLFRCNQYAIVETLNVSTSQRYASLPKATFCNVYAHDLVTAMGGYLPRVWWNPLSWSRIQRGAEIVTEAELNRMKERRESTKNVIAPIYNQTVIELSANDLTNWMHRHGPSFGWRKTEDMEEAQGAANSGLIAILLAAGKTHSGHVNVILAESDEHHATRHPSTGLIVRPLISQAGGPNVKYSKEGQADPKRPGRWWADEAHERGGAWIFDGRMHSPLVTPEEMGATGAVI